MFQDCNQLESLDLSNFNTSNVIYMESMFNGCLKLKEIQGINKLDTYRAENMMAFFQGCSELEYLDLSNFNTSNVIYMECLINVVN